MLTNSKATVKLTIRKYASDQAREAGAAPLEIVEETQEIELKEINYGRLIKRGDNRPPATPNR